MDTEKKYHVEENIRSVQIQHIVFFPNAAKFLTLENTDASFHDLALRVKDTKLKWKETI